MFRETDQRGSKGPVSTLPRGALGKPSEKGGPHLTDPSPKTSEIGGGKAAQFDPCGFEDFPEEPHWRAEGSAQAPNSLPGCPAPHPPACCLPATDTAETLNAKLRAYVSHLSESWGERKRATAKVSVDHRAEPVMGAMYAAPECPTGSLLEGTTLGTPCARCLRCLHSFFSTRSPPPCKGGATIPPLHVGENRGSKT